MSLYKDTKYKIKNGKKVGKGQTVNVVRINENGTSYEQITSKGSSACSHEDIVADINARLQKKRILPKMMLLSSMLSLAFSLLISLDGLAPDDGVITTFFSFFVLFLFASWPFMHFRRKKLSTIHLLYDIGPQREREIQKFFGECSKLAKTQRVWIITAENKHGDSRRHAGATSSVSRRTASVHSMPDRKMQTNLYVLSIDAWDKSVCFFPDKILYFDSRRLYPISYVNLDIALSQTHFREEESVPSDAEKTGSTWKYVKNDGTADKRFNNNRVIPILKYCDIEIKGNGCSLNFHTSNYDTGKAFANAINDYKNLLNRRGS